MTNGETTGRLLERLGEIGWYARRFGVLLKVWNVPINAVDLNSYPPEMRTGARAAALTAIVFLLFLMRPDLTYAGILPSAVSAALTVGVVIVLNLLAEFRGREIDDGIVINVYVSVIAIMLFYIAVRIFLEPLPPAPGATLRTGVRNVLVATGLSAGFLIGKSVFAGARFGARAAFGSLLVLAGSALLVIAIVILPIELFFGPLP